MRALHKKHFQFIADPCHNNRAGWVSRWPICLSSTVLVSNT